MSFQNCLFCFLKLLRISIGPESAETESKSPLRVLSAYISSSISCLVLNPSERNKATGGAPSLQPELQHETGYKKGQKKPLPAAE